MCTHLSQSRLGPNLLGHAEPFLKAKPLTIPTEAEAILEMQARMYDAFHTMDITLCKFLSDGDTTRLFAVWYCCVESTFEQALTPQQDRWSSIGAPQFVNNAPNWSIPIRQTQSTQELEAGGLPLSWQGTYSADGMPPYGLCACC